MGFFYCNDALKTTDSFISDTKEITRAKPFVQWVGSKRSIIRFIRRRIPKSYDAYYEPFLGGGSLFFALTPKKAFISDINKRLVTSYRSIRDNVDEVIRNYDIHAEQHNEEYYNKCRLDLSVENNRYKIASLFIYLNKTSYAGIYRVNKDDVFNIPIGRNKSPDNLDKKNLKLVSTCLQDVSIKNTSFDKIEVKPKCFYYFDPPYHGTYDQYDKSRFDDDSHKRLADMCHEIDKCGSYFILSNYGTDFIMDLYKKWNIETLMVPRNISCKFDERQRQKEIIVRNYQ